MYINVRPLNQCHYLYARQLTQRGGGGGVPWLRAHRCVTHMWIMTPHFVVNLTTSDPPAIDMGLTRVPRDVSWRKGKNLNFIYFN
jgi:hypothetical protein